jgi:hypothetical protein
MALAVERLFEAPAAHEADRFITRVQPIPGLPGFDEGHEILTRFATRGVLTRGSLEYKALIVGVIIPDRGGRRYRSFPGAAIGAVIDPRQQPRHSLRPTRSTSVARSLAAIRRTLRVLHARALAGSTPAASFRATGEALHLIQDSYSRAHTERAYRAGPGGTHPIRYIRWFGKVTLLPPRFSSGPREHNFPTDPRDQIYVTGASGKVLIPRRLKPESVLAVKASREYLAMMVRHLRARGAGSNATELRAFMDKHLRT